MLIVCTIDFFALEFGALALFCCDRLCNSSIRSVASVAKEEVLRLIPKMSELQLLEICDNEGLQLTKIKKDRKHWGIC